jgi:hypothetical protein
MKALKFLFFSFLCAIILTACQKQLYFDLNEQSIGTLKVQSNLDCLGDSVSGIFKKDIPLTELNYIDVQTNITKVGRYLIYSDTVNGCYFRGEGTFSTTGTNTARLTGVGMPIDTGVKTFKITYDANPGDCFVDIYFSPSINTTDAVFTLGGQPNTCTGVVLGPSPYYPGLPMTAGNTAAIDVTVLTPGNYSITTQVINGIKFEASGFLNTTDTKIVLTASGIPINGNVTEYYPIRFGGNECGLSLTFGPAVSPSTFTLGGTSGCDAMAYGTYTEGIPVNQTNYATISVDVPSTGLGYYYITTNTVNGISFSGSGVFTAPGVQTVTLYAFGTPLNAGPTPVIYSIDPGNGTGTCNLSVLINGDFIVGTFDGQVRYFNLGNAVDPTASAGFVGAASPNTLSIDGNTFLSTDNPSIRIFFNNVITITDNTTYISSTLPSNRQLNCTFRDESGNIFTGGNDPAEPFTLNIISIQGRCTGTFSGTLKYNGGAQTINVTNGAFDVHFRP